MSQPSLLYYFLFAELKFLLLKAEFFSSNNILQFLV